MKMYKYILIIFALTITVVGVGQNKYCYFQDYAIRAYQDADLGKAKELIDSALIVCPTLQKDSYTWHLRGFIYKDLFYKLRSSNANADLREKAIESFVKSLELDTTEEYLENNRKVIKHLAHSYFNDAAKFIDTNNYEKAIVLFNKYKATIRIIAPDHDFSIKQINFNNILAAVYKEQYLNNRNLNQEYLDKSIAMFSKTLAIDSMNYSANYNLGAIYYNIGVAYVMDIDLYTATMEDLNKSQEIMEKYCNIALPYLEKAIKIKETKEIIEGFRGIYTNLNDQEKQLFYERKLSRYDNDEYDKGSHNE